MSGPEAAPVHDPTAHETTDGGTDSPCSSGQATPILGELADLPGLLARSTTGLQFIYRALDILADRYRLRDALVVVEDPALGRQSFRCGRQLLRGSEPGDNGGRWARTVVDRSVGLHADPDVVDPLVATFVTDLMTLALRLDVLHHDATRDALTGLLNRRSYEILLEQAVARTDRYGWPFGLILLDLDGFKSVNDRLGHAVGDNVLRVLGAEMRASLRSGDVAARLGGDEFALLVANAKSAEVLDPLVQRLAWSLTRAFSELPIGFSYGVALFPTEATDAAALTRLADERLYRTKWTKAGASAAATPGEAP